LPVVFYGCEAGSFYVKGRTRLKVFENKVLRKISGPKRTTTREWKN
jgi:hypothetical protein